LKRPKKKYNDPEIEKKEAQQFILEKMITLYPTRSYIETREEFLKRIAKCKAELAKMLKDVPSDSEVAVVAHSTYLASFTAQSFNEKNKPVGHKTFENCEIFEFSLNCD